MGMLDTLNVGASGLAAASAGIHTTAQNVSNAHTPGYTRRGVEQSVNDPLNTGIVHLGQGVSLDAISRDQDGLLGMQRVVAAGDASASASYHDALAEVQHLVDETTTSGSRSQLSAFFDALTLATADPSDPGLREQVVQSAADLADAVARSSSGLEDARQRFEESIELALPPLSQKLNEVAMLNQRLIAAGGADQAPDIADQIDRLVRELGTEAGFTARMEADGTTTVMLDGHAVVSGTEARQISGAPPTGIRLEVGGGSVVLQPGGRLGGLARAHEAVVDYADQLDTFASSFATAVNDTQALGFDQSGNQGQPLFVFDPGSPAGSLAVADDLGGQDLAFAGSPTAAAGDGTNLAALIALEEQALVDGRTPGGALSALTDDVASDVSAAATAAERDRLVLSDLDTLSANLHGIDLDEEASKLMSYQTAYQASAKVLTVANELLGTLLEIA